MQNTHRKNHEAIHLRTMTVQDIPEVSALAKRVWEVTYPGVISRAQIDYMQEKINSPEAFSDQMVAQKHDFIVSCIDDVIVGYSSIFPTAKGEYKLSKLYVDADYHGRGIGRMLLDEMVKRYTPEVLRIFVNRLNIPAVNFYFKAGFIIEKAHDTEIGHGYYMNDYVMIRKYR